jgi:hypothetical protein
VTVIDPPTDAGTPVPLDTDMIRETYQRILLSPRLPVGKELAPLRTEVRGHVQVLAPDVRALAVRMAERMRRLAIHVLIDTAEILLEGEKITLAHLGPHTYDLVTMSRALLHLFEHHGPLGAATHDEEVSAEISWRVCGLCKEEFAEGEPADRISCTGSSGVIRAYVHEELCVGRREPRLTDRSGSPEGAFEGRQFRPLEPPVPGLA